MSSQKRFKFTKNYQNGDRYDGEAIGDNIKDGVGEYVWANQTVYRGHWANDAPHGKGVMVVPGAEGYEYDGEFVNGRRHGKGSCKFGNGREYTGEWVSDHMNGEGTLRGGPSDDFIEYKGMFENDHRSGPAGTCRYVDGGVYIGYWQNDKRHGLGEWQLPRDFRGSGGSSLITSSPVKYRGPFYADVASSMEIREPAEIAYADGSVYRGDVDRMEWEGNGELELKSGDGFKGQFSRNKRHGKGIMKYADGRVYEGTWKDDRIHGTVTFRNSDKALHQSSEPRDTQIVTYVGPTVMDEFTGDGAKVSYLDGSVYTGEVRQGLPNGRGTLENRIATYWPSEHFGPEVLIKKYEGNFFAGKPEGEGEGQLQIGSTFGSFSPQSSSEPSVPPGCKGLVLSYKRNGGFKGRWSQGVPEGTGVWRWDGGDYYAGPVHTGTPQGVGEYKSAQEQYQGEFANGAPSGEGRYEHLLLKESYDGQWREGLWHGKGVYNKEATRGGGDSVTYNGEWQRGKKHGHGVETIGSIHYEGDFASGKWHGKGVWRDSESGVTYEGMFANGELTGKGTMKLPSGTVIEGDFAQGRPHGEATVQFTSQGLQEFKGSYQDGRVYGEGEIRYLNGDHYKGEVEPSPDDNEAMPGLTPQRNGRGVFTFVEGNRLECTWNHNVLHGEGKYYAVGSDEPQTRHYVDGVVSTAQKSSDNVFTLENMFPNTQSEDALREKMQGNKPHKFIKKGESKTAANPAKKAESPSKKPVKKAKKTSLPSQPRPSVTGSNPTSGGPSPRKSSLPRVQNGKRASDPKKTTGKRTSITPHGRASTTPTDTSPPHAMYRCEEETGPSDKINTNKTATADLLDRFTNGIKEVDDIRPVTAGNSSVNEKMTPQPPPPRKRLTSNEKPSSIGGGERKTSRKDSLDRLMAEASAIRNPQDDEIHLITEDIRQFNEKIWQLRFDVATVSTPGQRTKKQDQLTRLIRERLEAVEKLHNLLTKGE